ncbi:MAG: hypothetical protein ABIJ08_05845 [Nanoarchaeota archaeon]
MKPRSAKNKGKRFQNEIAEKISNLLNIPTEKDGDIESRSMGLSGVDIILRGNAIKMLNVAIECKNSESWSVPQWIDQARANAKNGAEWIIFAKKNRFDPVVIMDADKFFILLKQVINLAGKVNFN